MCLTGKVIKGKVKQSVYDGAWRIRRAVLYILLWLAIHKEKKRTSVVIDNPSAASSPSLRAHLCSPSVTLLFSLSASCNVALGRRCQVYKYNKEADRGFENHNDDTIYVY